MALFSPRPSAAPQVIWGADLVHWIRFTDFDRSTVLAATPTRVESIRDYSPQVNSLPCVTSPGTRPTLTTGGINGKGYAQFTSSSSTNLLKATGFAGMPSGTGSNGIYCWCVVKFDAASLGNYVMTSTYAQAAGSYDSGLTLRKNNGNVLQWWITFGGGVGLSFITTANTLGSTNTYYLEGWLDQGTKKLNCTINAGTGGNAAVSASAISTITTANTIGGAAAGTQVPANTDLFSGRLYEFGLTKAWSSAQQATMRSYLQQFYNL